MNDMESEEEKRMEDARWKANRIVTMATINIQMVAMDQIEKALRKAEGFDGMLSKRNRTLKSYSKLLFGFRL